MNGYGYSTPLANALLRATGKPLDEWAALGIVYEIDAQDPWERAAFTGNPPRIDVNVGTGSDIVGSAESASFEKMDLFKAACAEMQIPAENGRYDIAPDTNQFALWAEVVVGEETSDVAG